MAENMVFCGRMCKTNNDWTVAEVSFHIDDLRLMWDWAVANDGKVHVKICNAKSGKQYACINTYKRNQPGAQLPSNEPQQATEHAIDKGNAYQPQESRYTQEDNPQPLSNIDQKIIDTLNPDEIPF